MILNDQHRCVTEFNGFREKITIEAIPLYFFCAIANLLNHAVHPIMQLITERKQHVGTSKKPIGVTNLWAFCVPCRGLMKVCKGIIDGFSQHANGTLNRSRKKSFNWYKKVIATNGEDLSN